MKIISLGLGVQSTALYLMSSLGIVDRADHAIFTDPGAEHPDTYKLLDYVLEWQKLNDGIPIYIVRKSLYDDLLKKKNSTGQRFAVIPAFTGNKTGMLRRQCTKEYKINPVMKKIRDLYGLKPRQRMPMTQVWLGISLDEIERMKLSNYHRITYRYPLIDERITREDCKRYLEDKDFINVKKSSCVFCPYHSDKGWKKWKDNYPDIWNRIVKIDSAIRDGLEERGLKNKLYLHRSRKSIKDIEFANQQEIFMCEEGFCGL